MTVINSFQYLMSEYVNVQILMGFIVRMFRDFPYFISIDTLVNQLLRYGPFDSTGAALCETHWTCS